MGKWSFSSIRQRILAYFIAIILVFTITIMIISGVLSRIIVNNLMEQNATSIVQTQYQIMENWKQSRMSLLKQLANNAILESMDWEQIEPFLQRLMVDAEEHHLSYFVATPDGNFNTTLGRDTGDILERKYFEQVFAGETVTSPPLVSLFSDEKIIIMATPIKDEDDSKVIGLLGSSIQLDKIQTNLDKLNFGKTESNVFIIDKEGNFIVDSEPEPLMESRIQELYPPWDTISNQEMGFFDYTRLGTKYRMFFLNNADLSDWTVLVEIPMRFFNEPVKQLIISLLFASLFCFILVLIAGSWFSSSITKPFTELNKLIKQGAEGILTVRAKIRRRDEIGEVSDSFNKMMDIIGTMTYYDPLTGLLNRPYFLDRLKGCFNEDTSIILALVSIQGLSEIKALLGPEIIDTLLINLANNLQTLNKSNVIVSRIAEAEFAVAIASDDANVLFMIEQIEKLIKTPIRVQEHLISTRLICGISICDNKDMDVDDFFRQAQTALYEAERSTSHPVKLYSPQIHDAIIRRLRFQTEIQTALNRQQFTIYYQPIIDLEKRSVMGKEALIRWNHPIRGLLLPGEFLMAAEEGGFIEEIGCYMLKHVCKQHKNWLKSGLNLGWVSVNISPKQFRTPHFSTMVQDILNTAGYPAEQLRIEITEDAMLSPTPAVLKNFRNFRDMGVQLSIDDFGTSYATLDYLVSYPMETLKIDRSFINYVVEDDRTQGLVRSIIGMGKNLSMTTIAEGVERYEQLNVLRHMGCLEAQGFLFSKPIFWKDYPKVHSRLQEQLQNDYFTDTLRSSAT